MKPNERQQLAIDANGKELLISASAGTGKTSSMCKRIVHRVARAENPLSLDRMLIVTYTVAASADMRRQLTKTLRDELVEEKDEKRRNRLKEQIRLLPSAQICTIDSFCLDLVRCHFNRLELSPRVRIIGKAEALRVKRRAMKKAMDELYENDDGTFTDLVDGFLNNYSDRELPDKLIDICAFFDNEQEGIDCLTALADRIDREKDLPFSEGLAGKTIAAKNRETLGFYQKEFERFAEFLRTASFSAGEIKNKDADLLLCERLISYVRELSEKAGDPAAFAESAALYNGGTLKKLDRAEYERFKYVKERFSKLFGKQSALKIDFDFSSRRETLEQEAKDLRLLHTLFEKYEKEQEKQKRALSVLEFSDVERFALRLLFENGEKTDLARSLAEDYDEIYVDEYQDVNPLQNRIFEALSRGNRYLVGDVKQSIYRFRGACPTIFSELRETYPMVGEQSAEREGKGRIFFEENYRCSPPIVGFVNFVCRRILNFCTDMTYRDEDDLVCSRKPDESGYIPAYKPAICLLTKNSPLFDADRTECFEAAYTARCIKALINGGVNGKDIAILVNRTKKMPELKRAFAKEGIPLDVTMHKGFFTHPEVIVLRCVLEMLNNPTNDIYLAGAMKSPVFGFTLDELLRIRRAGGKKKLYAALLAYYDQTRDEKCGKLLSFITDRRQKAKEWTADKLVFDIMQSCSLIQLLSYSQSESRRQEIKDNILYFYDLVRTLSADCVGEIGKVLSRIADMANEDDAGDGKSTVVTDGHVRLMTMHSSKGLEFPVCWLYGCAGALEKGGEKIDKSKDFGVTFQIKDKRFPQFRLKSENYTANRILCRANEKSEAMRLIYVALTRAKDRLFISGTVSDKTVSSLDKLAQLSDSGRAAADLCGSHLDLILLASDGGREGADVFLDEYPFDTNTLLTGEKKEPEKEDPEELSRIRRQLEERLDFAYPHEGAVDLPAKLAVSVLYPGILDENGEQETPDETADSILNKGESARVRKPRFILEKEGINANDSPALRGSATHAFMQFCDFGAFEKESFDEAFRKESQRLKEQKFLDEATLKRVEKKGVERFFGSELYKMIMRADRKRFYREQRFMIALPAADFTSDEEKKAGLEGEEMLVQGVIDGFFEAEDGRIVLFDYKTDHFKKEELRDPAACERILIERHKLQLSYYKEAVRRMLGRQVDLCCIYSFALSKEIRL